MKYCNIVTGKNNNLIFFNFYYLNFKIYNPKKVVAMDTEPINSTVSKDELQAEPHNALNQFELC